MQVARENLPSGRRTTVAQARDALASSPAFRDLLGSLKGARRWKVRKDYAEYYGQEVTDVLIPPRVKGRPVEITGPWASLVGPARAAIDDLAVLPKPVTETAAADWTTAAVTAAADAIVKKYPNVASAAMTISALRSALTALGVPPDIVKASARPDLTRAHNAIIAARRAERVAEGFDAPAPFERIADLITRIDAYLAGNSPPDGQTAADLLVALSARPGEAESLVIGEHGGVKGVLKKRGTNDEMPLITAVGRDRAAAFLEKWKDSTVAARRRAMREADDLVREWGIQKRDLRAVGAMLAVRAAALTGVAVNATQERDIHRAALRHAEPTAAAAQDHYGRVNDPIAGLCAQLAELSIEDRTRIAAMMRELSSGTIS